MKSSVTNQKGFTILEMIVSIFVLCGVALGLFLLYALVHFIMKFW